MTATTRRDVFQAIADPTRRAILGMLAKEQLNLNTVAGHFSVSRPAISKHIKILTECGLVTVHQQGRERYCEARLQELHVVTDWVEKYRKIWTSRLDRLDDYLLQIQAQQKTSGKQKKAATKKKRN